MFNIQNPVQRVSPAAQTGLTRLLLQCRYDFQNRIWNLPASQAGLNDRLSFSNSRAALLPLLNVVIAEFSDPSLGGANPSKSATRRIGIRHSLQRSLGKIKKPKQPKKEK
jgi:hypothetical protein